MMGRRGVWLVGMLLAALLVAACGPAPTETPGGGDSPLAEPTRMNTLPVEPTPAPGEAGADLEGVTWMLLAYRNSEGERVELLPDSEATARFEGGQVKGNASCNSYFGGYELDGVALRIGSLGMTEMYCYPEALMAQEGEYLAALGRVASWVLEGDTLRLVDDGAREVLTFERLKPAALVGTRWLLTGYNDGQGGFVSVLNGTEVTALFGEDGQVAGSAGCNNYFASYELSGDALKLGPAGSTLMACADPEGIMAQEDAFLAALGSVASFQIEGQQLALLAGQGQALLTFTVGESASLSGTTWQVVGYNNGRGGVTSVIIGTELTAVFDEGGRLAGSAGCNQYFADYRLEDQDLAIGPAGSTRMACLEPDGIMDQENEFLAALERVATYRIEGDRLQLRDVGGALQVEMLKIESGEGQ